jgi:hypothetical protein
MIEFQAFQPGAFPGLTGTEEEKGTGNGFQFSLDHDAKVHGNLAST